jgi:hypothetical protein
VKYERAGSHRFEASFLVNWNRLFRKSRERFFDRAFLNAGQAQGDQFKSQNRA